MKKSNLIIEGLEESLSFWEDLILVNRLHEKSKITRDINLSPQIETFETLVDLKSIRNPEEFRNELYKKNDIVPTRFLPFVPKSEQSPWLNPIDYTRTAPINGPSLAFFPYMVSNWLKTKKVFEVDPGIIPLMNPKKIGIRDLFSKKNFLSLLPCDSFIINFSTPLEIELESLPIIKRYKSCIVVRSGNLVDTFWIPDEIESKSIGPEGRSLIKKLLANKKNSSRDIRKLRRLEQSVSIGSGMIANQEKEDTLKIGVEPPYFAIKSFLIDKPYTFVKTAGSPENETVKIYRDIFKNPPVEYAESNGRYKFIQTIEGETDAEKINISERIRSDKFFFEFINGFCYALSKIKSPESELIESGKKMDGSTFSPPLTWNEIPITRVEYLIKDIGQKKLRISYGSGEKDFHVRRGHWRHYLKKDGTTETIWIEQTFVRPDKLLNGGVIKGSVTVIKQNKLAAK